ncbi:bifunctional 5,10-methylenetetrahydrofolate dehydrogenase/5,10-methenyltetrahydrofolate cyclohydrolase [Patescibacteria group bacterium]|nr:bifunctional 5,10-methylenetetrahydrofolate dehydrogenase/5,10-methenyltetrahydrofolate cyclohydrolase [Patescibacteria group bacterium]
MKVFDGHQLALQIEAELKQKIQRLKRRPQLTVFLLNNNPESQLYVQKKKVLAERIGVNFNLIQLIKAETNPVLQLIKEQNNQRSVAGIMVQLPLNRGLNERKILDAIDPQKDVDCLTSKNLGLVAAGQPRFLPATVKGIMTILTQEKVVVRGRQAVVVGGSNIVGKPLALVLSNQGATVTLVRSSEKNLAQITRQADILITAVGRQNLIKASMVKEGAVVIDVGITRCDNQECHVYGDVDFKRVKTKASLITPVPGGVGPLTVVSLFENLIL